MGLAEEGVGLSAMTQTKDLIPAAYLAKVDELKQQIIGGQIQVWDVSAQGYPDFFQ